MKKLKLVPRLVILLLFFNCTQEEVADEITETPVALSPEIVKIKEQLNMLYGDDPFPNYPGLELADEKGGKSENPESDLNLTIEWDNYTTFTDGELEVYEFRASEPASSEVVSELVETFTYTLLSVARDGETAYYLMKLSHMEGSDLRATFSDPAGFTGTAQVYDMENRIKAIHYFEQGEMKSKISGPELEGSKTGRGNCHANRAGTNGGPFDFNTPTCNNGGGGRYVDVIIYHYTDNYNYRGNGEWEYSNSTFNGISTETIWIPDENDDPVLQIDRFLPREYTGQRGGQYDPADFYNWYNANRDEQLARKETLHELFTLVDEQILSTDLDPCSDQILEKLKNLEQNDMAKILWRFGATDAIYTWEIETAPPVRNPENSAETDWRRNSTGGAMDYNYVTYISPSYQNGATTIALARTVLHEMLHAYILSHIDDVQNGNTSSFVEFRELWRLIQQDLTGFNNNPEPTHHQFMASKFIPPLREALKEWDNSSNPNDQYYEDLAWGALIDTDTFDNLHPIGSVSRNRVINTNAAEDTNSNQNGTSPKGNPCN